MYDQVYLSDSKYVKPNCKDNSDLNINTNFHHITTPMIVVLKLSLSLTINFTAT